ncbi:transforming growth factor-beta-induced protein ig-h3-like [Penaeus indicus]|uniref:transforming growth factor-beta-induced protein ig-h3-like n=1 Tax=Penaeus indicus TaxID=29960 RepID=UPI00300D85D4
MALLVKAFVTLTALVGISTAQQWRADVRLGDLARFTSTLESSLGNLADRIEEEVQNSLPRWMRNRGREDSADTRHVSPLAVDEGIEAISGIIGDGIDDGLKVHMDGDTEGKIVEGPLIEPVEPEVEAIVPAVSRPVMPDHDFDGTFLFRPFRPFDRRPGFSMFDILNNRRRQWWKGPNVCVDQEEIDEGRSDVDASQGHTTSSGSSFIFSFGQMEVTSCQETGDKYTCTTKTSRRGINKTVKVTYRCCHGYAKTPSGCSRVQLRELPDTLQNIGATDFLSLTKSINMENVLRENITLFVPSNEAMQEFTVDLEAENEFDNDLDDNRTFNEVVYRRRRSVDAQELVLAHIAKGLHYSGDLQDEQVLNSMAKGSTLRVNTYSTLPPSATINCARIVGVNQHSSSGIVHTIDKVLRPVTRTLAELVESRPEFSILRQLLTRADMMKTLQEPGQLTLFAPTDDAFRSVSPLVLEGLLEGNACLDAVIKSHILPNVICSAAVQGKARTVNLLDSYLMLEKTGDNEIFVGDAEVLEKDVMGTNGVLHVISGPLMPQEAKPLFEVLEAQNLTRFMDLLEAADMLDELKGLTDVTVFAPSNRAVDEIPEEVMENIINDPSRLREILEYHMATPTLKASDISNNHIVSTRADHPLRINLYSRSPLLSGLISMGRRHPNMRMTAGCSHVSALDSRACGAVVHVVEKMLVVPKINVMDLLEMNEDFSIFTKMLKDTGLNETLVEDGPFTVLAPSDHVFRILPEEELNHLLEDQELQQQLVTQHIMEEHLCCTGINPNTWLFMDHKRTLNGSPIHVRRTNSGRLMAGPARITHCSSPTRNGLVHTVSHLLMNVHRHRVDDGEDCDRRHSFSSPGLELLFGF